MNLVRSTSSAAPAIELDGIAHRFGHRWVLRGASARVAAGELVTLAGRNGSGKTTLLRILATLLRPTRGRAAIAGRDLRDDPDAARRSVGFLAHTSGLYDDLTAAENLRFAARMMGVPADSLAIASALDAVGLGREADERVRTFSSGMQRRLAIARVKLGRPRILLMDEPYNSIDADGIALVNTLLDETRAAGGSALVVMHDLVRGAHLMDRVLELDQGRIVSDTPGAANAAAGKVIPGPWRSGQGA